MTQKILLGFFLWLVMLVTACGQTQSTTLPQTGKVSVALKQLLPPGVAKVAVMDSVTMDPRLTVLLVKFQQGIKANPQYMIDMQKRTAKQGPGPMPYDKRVGMSEPEFQELQALMGKREMKVAASYMGEITVIHKDGAIHFAGTGRLDMMNEIWIDLAKNEAHFSEYTLPYTKELAVTDAKNAFGSAWTSYEWELTKPDGETFEDISLEKIKSMNMLMLQLHVGKLTKTGKTFLKVKGTRVDKGIKKFSFDTPLFLD